MKKVLLLAVVAALGMTSCGSEESKDEEKKDGETTEEVSQENELDKLCECYTEILDMAESFAPDKDNLAEVMFEIEAKEKECITIQEKLKEGKSYVEFKKMEEDFEKNCKEFEFSGIITVPMIKPEKSPVITFENEVFDFGEIALGSTVSYAFKFENTGEGPLIFHDVKPSSGCTALKNWPKGVLKPGSKGEINIEFTPNIEGNTTETVSIVTNTNPSVMKLSIKGEVVGG